MCNYTMHTWYDKLNRHIHHSLDAKKTNVMHRALWHFTLLKNKSTQHFFCKQCVWHQVCYTLRFGVINYDIITNFFGGFVVDVQQTQCHRSRFPKYTQSWKEYNNYYICEFSAGHVKGKTLPLLHPQKIISCTLTLDSKMDDTNTNAGRSRLT